MCFNCIAASDKSKATITTNNDGKGKNIGITKVLHGFPVLSVTFQISSF